MGQNSIIRLLVFSLLAMNLMGCGLRTVRGDAVSAEVAEPTAETSLAEDQKSLEELRKNIPTEKRRENDQLKEILGLMGEVKDPPQRIRDRFNRTTQKMREVHRREVKKLREDFNRAEKKQRDEFFNNLKEEREEFLADKKATREERQKFTDDQDRRRREFTGDERDRRQQFNADLKQREDDFNANMRDKNNEFTQELRAYTQRYNDVQKQLREKKREGSATPGVSNASPATPGYQPPVSPLQTGKDEK